MIRCHLAKIPNKARFLLGQYELGAIRGAGLFFFPQQFTGGYAEIGGKFLNALNRRDGTTTLSIRDEVFSSTTFRTGYSRSCSSELAYIFDILHKNRDIHRASYL